MLNLYGRYFLLKKLRCLSFSGDHVATREEFNLFLSVQQAHLSTITSQTAHPLPTVFWSHFTMEEAYQAPTYTAGP